MRRTRAWPAFCLLVFAACSSAPKPAELNPRGDSCASCRMVISDVHFASQIVAPLEEPRFFDDLNCLDRYLETTPLPKGAVIFVADHRTGEWIPSTTAVYAKLEGAAAPMGSGIVAHASLASRAADPDAASAIDVDREKVLPHLTRQGASR